MAKGTITTTNGTIYTEDDSPCDTTNDEQETEIDTSDVAR